VSILKKGIRFTSQDTGRPLLEEEIPFVITSLTNAGMRAAAEVGFYYLHKQGFSLDQALDILGNPKESPKCTISI
jgi:hypothetical protein